MRVNQLLDRLNLAARRAGFTRKHFLTIGDYELPEFSRISEIPSARRLYISAGVHGNEPAGPMAILEMLTNKRIPDDLNVSLIPVINPTGLENSTRENAQGIDINRDFGPTPQSEEAKALKQWLAVKTFDLALCLHEDFESSGSYLYEIKPDESESVASQILDAMEPFTGIDPSPEIDGMPVENGLMKPPVSRFRESRDGLPEALLITFDAHAPWCFTIETPSSQNIVQRIGAQIAAVRTAVKSLL